jgi:hypothetical protein
MQKIFIVEAASGVHAGACVLGVGASRAEAVRDAYGPGGKLPYHAWVRELLRSDDPERFDELQAGGGF